MKTISLAFVIMLSLGVVSCGKKEGGGGDSSSSGLSSNSCNRNGDIDYDERNAYVNWGTGVIRIGDQSYQPNQVTPNTPNVITAAYGRKGNVLGRTDGSINQYTGQPNVTYRLRIRAALVPAALTGGLNGFNQGVPASSCSLDIQSAKFRNY